MGGFAGESKSRGKETSQKKVLVRLQWQSKDDGVWSQEEAVQVLRTGRVQDLC